MSINSVNLPQDSAVSELTHLHELFLHPELHPVLLTLETVHLLLVEHQLQILNDHALHLDRHVPLRVVLQCLDVVTLLLNQ